MCRQNRLAPAAILLAIGAVRSTSADVLHDHDGNPFSAIFGLPDATEGGLVLPGGDWSAEIYAVTASHAISTIRGDESLVVDGETSRVEIRYRRGFGDRLELGFELPYLTHQAGGLDSVIDDWHDFFGLPDGARDRLPRDRLNFTYNGTAGTMVSLTDSAHGLGDMRIYGGFRLRDNERYASALRFSVKLPTGEADTLLGSGSIDWTAGLAGDWKTFGESGDWSAFYRLNVMLLGEPEFLASRHNEFALQGAAGVSWQASRRVGLTLQGSARSALYDSDTELLGEPSVLLTFGGDVRLSEQFRLFIAVGEDIKVNSAPDVSFQLALRYLAR